MGKSGVITLPKTNDPTLTYQYSNHPPIMTQTAPETNSKDLIIAQLRQDLAEAREKASVVPELTEKLTNLEFTLQMLTSDKHSVDKETTIKSEQSFKLISQLRSEVDILTRKLTSEESKSKITKSSLAEYELELQHAKEDKAKIEKDMARLAEELREAQLESKRFDKEKVCTNSSTC